MAEPEVRMNEDCSATIKCPDCWWAATCWTFQTMSEQYWAHRADAHSDRSSDAR